MVSDSVILRNDLTNNRVVTTKFITNNEKPNKLNGCNILIIEKQGSEQSIQQVKKEDCSIKEFDEWMKEVINIALEEKENITK